MSLPEPNVSVARPAIHELEQWFLEEPRGSGRSRTSGICSSTTSPLDVTDSEPVRRVVDDDMTAETQPEHEDNIARAER